MTNPFANAATARTATPAAAPATAPAQQPTFQAPAVQTQKPAPAPAAKVESAGTGFGDPFGQPAGPGSGEKITDMLGSLLLVKPTEYIEEMSTSSGDTDAVRADIAILDNTEEPGHIAEGVLIFQMALKRDLRKIMDSPQPYLLGRLDRGQAKVKGKPESAPYIFVKFTEEEAALANQFLQAVGKF